MIGNKNGSHPCSEETKEKIRQAIDYIIKETDMNIALIPHVVWEKLKQAAKNRKSSPCSEDKKIKLQNNYPYMQKVYCLETNTLYKSIQDCGRQLGLNATNICAVCKGKHKTHKGYHFQYINSI